MKYRAPRYITSLVSRRVNSFQSSSFLWTLQTTSLWESHPITWPCRSENKLFMFSQGFCTVSYLCAYLDCKRNKKHWWMGSFNGFLLDFGSVLKGWEWMKMTNPWTNKTHATTCINGSILCLQVTCMANNSWYRPKGFTTTISMALM